MAIGVGITVATARNDNGGTLTIIENPRTIVSENDIGGDNKYVGANGDGGVEGQELASFYPNMGGGSNGGVMSDKVDTLGSSDTPDDATDSTGDTDYDAARIIAVNSVSETNPRKIRWGTAVDTILIRTTMA